jgi:hypothetical protein
LIRRVNVALIWPRVYCRQDRHRPLLRSGARRLIGIAADVNDGKRRGNELHFLATTWRLYVSPWAQRWVVKPTQSCSPVRAALRFGISEIAPLQGYGLFSSFVPRPMAWARPFGPWMVEDGGQG